MYEREPPDPPLFSPVLCAEDYALARRDYGEETADKLLAIAQSNLTDRQKRFASKQVIEEWIADDPRQKNQTRLGEINASVGT